MNILVLTAHPNLANSSTNRQWFEALSQENKMTTRDLMTIGGPTMQFDVAQEQALLQKADRVVLQFPFYWYSSPPVLKAWLDQVLSFGFAFGFGGKKLEGKELMLAISTGGPAQSYQPGSYNSLPMSDFLTPFEQTAKVVGMTYLPPFVLHSAMTQDPNVIKASVPALISHIQAKKSHLTRSL